MGRYSNQYIPRISHQPGLAQSSIELVSADKKGEIKYTNDDEFIFVNHDNTETTLSSITTPILTNEIEFSSAEIQAGISKTLLVAPSSGYTNNILGIYLYFFPGTVEYSGVTYLSLNHEVEGVSTVVTNYIIQTNINNTVAKILRHDSSSFLVSDLDTSYTITCPPTADGNGSIKAVIHYIQHAI